MVISKKFVWLLLLFICRQFNIYYATTAWPLANSSSIQLLGLFKDVENASETSESSVHSRAMFKAAILLSQQYNITIEGRFIEWQSAQTGGNVITALSNMCHSVSHSNIVGIVGPGLSREAHLIADFAKAIGIPVISYAAADPDLSDRNTYPAFHRTIPSDRVAASAIVKLFLRFAWTSCLLIYQNDAFGSNGAKVINEAFIHHGLSVKKMIVFDIVTRRIRGDLKTYLTFSATRIIVLWADSAHTSLILQNALDSDVLGPRFTWILSSSIPLNSFHQTFHDKLIGMLTVEPVTGTIVDAPINTTILNAAYNIWNQYEPATFPQSGKVHNFALFAFDATWSLIQSLQTLCSTARNSSSSSCLSFIESSSCFHRRFVHADLLLDTVSAIDFLGVSGPIRFTTDVTDRINGSYYYAQNCQPSSNGLSFVPILTYADPGEWKQYTGINVIIWPDHSLTPPTDRAVLEGISLKVGVIESPPYTIVTKVIDKSGETTTKLSGFSTDLIEILQNRMKFIPKIQLASSNETYDGLVQAVADGVYDIVVGDVTITAARRKLAGFSNAILDNSLRIVIRKTPATSIDFSSYLKPFSRSLWLLVLCASMFAASLFYLLEKQQNHALQNQPIISSAAMSLWFSLGTILGCGADFQPRTAAGRLLTIGLYILSLILVATYTANLASDLTISKSKNIISGIDDLKRGKISYSRIGIRPGATSEDYYLREISGGSRNYYKLKSRQDGYDALLTNFVDATIMGAGVAEYITSSIYCNLTAVGESFDNSVFGIVTPKEWVYADDLDVNILSLRELGILDQLRQKWFKVNNCYKSSDTSTEMKIESMSGLFLTFGVICILSLLLFSWKKQYFEKLFSRIKIFKATVVVK